MLKLKSPQTSFFMSGSYLYDRIVPVDHLLRKINAVVVFGGLCFFQPELIPAFFAFVPKYELVTLPATALGLYLIVEGLSEDNAQKTQQSPSSGPSLPAKSAPVTTKTPEPASPPQTTHSGTSTSSASSPPPTPRVGGASYTPSTPTPVGDTGFTNWGTTPGGAQVISINPPSTYEPWEW